MGIAVGCVSTGRAAVFAAKLEALDHGRAALVELKLGPRALGEAGVNVSADGGRRSGYEALAMPGAEISVLSKAFDEFRAIDAGVLAQLQIDSTYDQYAGRQEREVADLRRQETQRIPAEFDYDRISGLSNELKLKLRRDRPETVLQASRIEGVTPAALLLILAHLRKPHAIRVAG